MAALGGHRDNEDVVTVAAHAVTALRAVIVVFPAAVDVGLPHAALAVDADGLALIAHAPSVTEPTT